MNTQNNSSADSDVISSMMASGQDPDASIQRLQLANEVKGKLTLDPGSSNIRSTGTVTVHRTLDGGTTWDPIVLPIRSIPAAIEREIEARNRIEQMPDIPQIQDDKTGKWVIDINSPQYLEFGLDWLEATTRMQYEKAVYGLDVNLCSADGTGDVIWDSDAPNPDQIDDAIEALIAYGFSTEQIADVCAEIVKLSGQHASEQARKENEQAKEENQFEKKVLRRSAIPENSTRHNKRRRSGQRRTTR